MSDKVLIEKLLFLKENNVIEIRDQYHILPLKIKFFKCCITHSRSLKLVLKCLTPFVKFGVIYIVELFFLARSVVSPKAQFEI